jgi:hypothetical protein
VLLAASACLAVRNIRNGRGDRRAAGRLAAVALATSLLAWLPRAHHVADFAAEQDLIARGLAHWLFEAGIIGLLYLALEPEVRRRWPESEVSWNRLIAGRWPDRLVASHVLIGALAGVAGQLSYQMGQLMAGALGWPPCYQGIGITMELLGGELTAAPLLRIAPIALSTAMYAMCIFMLLRRVLGSRLVAAVAYVAIALAVRTDWQQASAWSCLARAVVVSAFLAVMLRWGLLPASVALFYLFALRYMPITPRLSCWYGHITLAVVGLLAALAVAAWSQCRRFVPAA